jgi:hypothetical protein
VPFGIKHLAPLLGRLILLFAVSAGLLVLMLPGARKPIDYMIVGTFATAISLAVVLGWWVRLRR